LAPFFRELGNLLGSVRQRGIGRFREVSADRSVADVDIDRSLDALVAARAQLIGLDLIAYEAPLYQVLSMPGAVIAPRAQRQPTLPEPRHAAGLVRLGDLLGQLGRKP